jgi:hypothetical protein
MAEKSPAIETSAGPIMQLKLRSIAVAMFRSIASGVIAFCIGAAAPLLSRKVLGFAYVMPGAVTAMLLMMALYPLLRVLGDPIPAFLAEQGIEGPVAFAALSVLCGFLFWWIVIFATWTCIARRNGRIHVLPVVAIAWVLLIPFGWLFVLWGQLLKSRAPEILTVGPSGAAIFGTLLLIGGLGLLVLWLTLIVYVWRSFRRLRDSQNATRAAANKPKIDDEQQDILVLR